MTNEEAADILQAIKFMLTDDCYTEFVEEALDMAIETLEERTGDTEQKARIRNDQL